MIITRQKDIDRILAFIGDRTNIFLIGCKSCATTCKTGGEKELDKMEEKLALLGKKVLGKKVLDPSCSILEVKRLMRENKEVINQCEVILSLACGGGTQAVAEVIDGKKIIPGNDSLFQGEITRITTSGSHFEQKCSLCADCMLGETGGICPVTRCPKGLRNGPCGGAKNRKCEINKGLDCVWITIYKRLTDIGEMRNMYKYKEPRDHTRTKQPQSLDI